MEDVKIRIEDIYVPAGRRRELDGDKVATLAENILEEGLKLPISVRKDTKRYVLVEGLHRLEACKALGEDEITAIVVRAKQH